MQRLKRGGMVAATVAVVVGISYAAVGSSRAVTGVARFRQTIVSHTNQGRYAGATEVWSSKLLLLHEAKTIGTGGVACLHITSTVRECFGTFVLPLGRIHVQDRIATPEIAQLSIVGGLGAYTDAKGVAVFSPGRATFFIT